MSSKNLPARAEDRSLKLLVSDLKDNSSLLVRQEIALAKADVREKVKGVAKKAITFSIAGVLAYAGILVVLAALILAVIALGVAAWLAALLVGIGVLGGAFLLVQRARRPAKESA